MEHFTKISSRDLSQPKILESKSLSAIMTSLSEVLTKLISIGLAQNYKTSAENGCVATVAATSYILIAI